jgi:hypothetical protein
LEFGPTHVRLLGGPDLNTEPGERLRQRLDRLQRSVPPLITQNIGLVVHMEDFPVSTEEALRARDGAALVFLHDARLRLLRGQGALQDFE